jgi:hypothetical protein
MKMKTTIAAIAILGVTLSLYSCSNDEFCDDCTGYFRTVCGIPIGISCGYESGVQEIKLTGSKSESIIPIVFIADDRDKYFKTEYTWAQYEADGLAVVPATIYTQAGYDSYPNSLDFTYHYQWADFSTYKEPNSPYGVLRIAYEENPYNVSREIWILLKNEQKSEAYIIQDANPNGISPSED